MLDEFENLGSLTLPVETKPSPNNEIGHDNNSWEKLAKTATGLLAARTQVNTDPTEAQKDSGNYRKGHVSWKGLQVTLENPKGSTRSGTSGDGKSWSIKMKHDYGYFKGTTGKDGDHVDVLIGPEHDSELVFVINQVLGGKFDEHKVIIGAIQESQAREIYLSNYEAGWQGLGSVTAMTLPDFKIWVTDHKLTRKQAADWDEQLRKMHKRRGECSGCGKTFPEGEPYADVEMCETCERFGASNKDSRDEQ